MQKRKNARQIPNWSGRVLYHDYPNLNGDDVAAWQDQAGGVVVDGYFKKEDAERCKQIQALNELIVDGIVGPQTWYVTFGRKE